MKLRGLSLFANVGIAETYLNEIGVDVVIANEIDEQRVKFYKDLYPHTNMIHGDITQEYILNNIISLAKKEKIDFIIATPPCQGMSTAGKMNKLDPRNHLITYAIRIIKELKPKYVFLENVPQQLKTKIYVNDEIILIPDYIKSELSEYYNFNSENIINAKDYGIAQNRQRSIFLLGLKENNLHWKFPKKESKIKTLREVIGELPSLDPLIYDIPYEKHLEIFPNYEEKKRLGLKVSKWHFPPEHVFRQVISIIHTPTGKSAFENIDDKYKPTTKEGTIVKGFKNTYKRQEWDKPAYTITMYNRTISSQNNVHPGVLLGKNKDGIEIYSDPRVLTILEIMRVMSLPDNWKIPDWASENFIRQIIGEGIPPLLVKKIFNQII